MKQQDGSAGRRLVVKSGQLVRMLLGVLSLSVSLPTTATEVHELTEGAHLVQNYLDEVSTMRTRFRQTLLDEEFQIIGGPETGELLLERPGKFRWDYREPSERLILADGQRLWMYEVDLDQVIVRPLDRTLASTPAMLLSGEGQITEGYDVTAVFDAEGIVWVELAPKIQETDFERVRLGFENREFVLMQLLDRFGQTTHIEFSDTQKNIPLEPDLFSFAPPEGVDVIGEDVP